MTALLVLAAVHVHVHNDDSNYSYDNTVTCTIRLGKALSSTVDLLLRSRGTL